MIGNTPYTVLHTESSMGWGGQEMRILREIIGLSRRGWKMMLACDPGSELFLHALQRDIPLIPIHFSYPHALRVLRQLRHAIREYDIRLVHTHSSTDAWLGGIAARSVGARLVRTRHLCTPIRGGWNARWLYGQLADAVICTSSAAVAQVRSHLPNKAHVECIATGIEQSSLEPALLDRAAARKQIGLEEGEIAVGTACILRSWKGIEEFLAAAEAFAERPEVKFFIFGGGQGLGHYRKLAQQHYPRARVTFTGHLDPVTRALAALDIFCLLSTAHEGISQASLQAAYLGKPLVTTPVGGLAEVCYDRKTGLCVPIKNAQAVTEALRELIDDRALRDRLGQSARELVKQHYTFEQMLDAVERILYSIVPTL